MKRKLLWVLSFLLIASNAFASTYYTHRYSNVNNVNDYQIVAHYDDGLTRIMAQENETLWVAAGGVVTKESGNRFILINAGVVSVDPNMSSILAAEALAAANAAAAAKAEQAAGLAPYMATAIVPEVVPLVVTEITPTLNLKEPANSNIQTHISSVHAPTNAQKNSDITKAEIEAKLTGELTSHSHAGGGGGLGYTLNVQALTSSPVDARTVYFGQLPKAPITTANVSKVYIRKAGTIKIAQIYCYSGTAGTAEAWSLYIQKNNSADTLIATVSSATNERVFTNSSLNIAVVEGDYIEIKGIQPTWITNPATTIFSGYLYIE
jgi:hypothetical protein